MTTYLLKLLHLRFWLYTFICTVQQMCFVFFLSWSFDLHFYCTSHVFFKLIYLKKCHSNVKKKSNYRALYFFLKCHCKCQTPFISLLLDIVHRVTEIQIFCFSVKFTLLLLMLFLQDHSSNCWRSVQFSSVYNRGHEKVPVDQMLTSNSPE